MSAARRLSLVQRALLFRSAKLVFECQRRSDDSRIIAQACRHDGYRHGQAGDEFFVGQK